MAGALNIATREAQIMRAIDKIYETALEPAQWTDLLRTIGGLVGASQGSLFLLSLSQKTFSDFGYGRNEEMVALYNTRFIGEDPWYDGAAKLRSGVVITGQELYPTRNLARTAYYNECLKLGEVYDCLGVVLESARDLSAGLGFQRSEFLPTFEDEEKRLLAILVPHLQRLIQIHRRFDNISAAAALQTEVLNRLSFGVVLVSGCSIRFANRAAQEIAAACDGLHLSSKGLTADNAEDNAALAQAQKVAARSASHSSAGPRGSTIAVRRPSLKRPYAVHVMPLSDRVLGTARILGDNNPALLITITDPTMAVRPVADVLMQAYGMTPAEASLALKLGEGASLKEAADQLAISEQTARWHLKNVLAKTETNRQSELVGMLMRTTMPLRPDGQCGH